MNARPARAPRPKRHRGLTEKLGSIVLGFEFVIVFLAGLVLGGLGKLPWPIALTFGIGLSLLMLITAGLMRYRWAVWLGWFCQAVFMAGGLLEPMIFIVAGLFIGMWGYCMVVGARADNAPPSDPATV